MSESLQQITIPDIGDEDVGSTTTPFGRGFGFGNGSGFGSSGFGSSSGFGGGFGSGLDSPGGASTPQSSFQPNDRSYFSHSRGDSNASIDSTGSTTTRFASKPGTPFSHSAQPSFAASSTPFTKKPSFASIRNAFKSSKSTNTEAPPMPPLDNTAYPVLKNPFGNHSTTSLPHVGMVKGSTPPTSVPTMSYPRPGTPGNNDSRSGRGAFMKGKGHGYTRSQHSHSGSVFGVSDLGNEGIMPSPPPVPRVPSAYGKMFQEDGVTGGDLDDDKVVMDLKTPSDYALHAVFIRFASTGEENIDNFLRQPLDQDVLLTTFIGPGVDTKFDETLQSLGIIAQKHAKQVIDSILRWRRIHIENVGSELIRLHLSNRVLRASDVPSLLNERKSLASIYIMCRALVAVIQTLSKDALGDTLGFSLEETTFEQFRKPDRQHLTQSSNHRINTELYATLLGHLANVRFISVTDRFLAELGPVSQNTISKDVGTKYENLVKGLRYIKIKVYPPEAFEEGAEFMESLSKSFANAHGVNFKLAFAETLVTLLHPIGKTAQAETNHPEWGKSIEVIYPKAREMMSKPRYWTSAFPLAVTSLCMAPQTYFLKHWQAFFESTISKLKEKPSRTVALNGMIRLVWTYLYRCQESTSTTMTKLETLLKPFFSSSRTVTIGEDLLEPLTYILHFILSRHPEYGREMCLELLQETAINNLQQKGGNISSLITPEKVAIVINAVLLSVHNIEREVLTPSWPSSSDFTVIPSKDDYPTSSAHIPPTLLKPGLQDFLNRCGSTLAHVTAYCGNAVGSMSVFDDQYSYAKLSTPYEDSGGYSVRRHIDGIVTIYPNSVIPSISVLVVAFQAWPRFLHPSIALSDVVDLLLRGVIHVEPAVAEAATAALKRFVENDSNATQVISRFNYFLFSPSRVCHEAGVKLHIEYPPLLDLWFEVVQEWIQTVIQRGIDSFDQPEQIVAKCGEVEAAALFLLANAAEKIRCIGIKAVKLLGTLVAHLAASNVAAGNHPFYVTERLQGRCNGEPYWSGYDDLLDKAEQSRLELWQKLPNDEVLLRIVDSPNEKDGKLWRYIFPSFLQHCGRQSPSTLGVLREAIIASVSRYHPLISYLAGLSTRMPAGLISRNSQERDSSRLLQDNKLLVDQWHIWIKILCSTATPPDSSRPTYTPIGREHSRAPSEVSFDRERYLTTRGLFRHLTPFLDSEHTLFRDAAALCISSFSANAYPYLLEDLSLLAGRQFYDDPRSKATTPAVDQTFGLASSRQPLEDTRGRSGSSGLQADRNRRQERLHSAVARIYFITAPLLEQQRSSNRTAALSNILKFVRNTQSFLSAPEMRENYSLNRLRRYFCGIIERLFVALANLKDSERFIPPQMHLTLFRLCEDWCQVGPMTPVAKELEAKLKRMIDASEATDGGRNASQRVRYETVKLSHASVGALAALCQKAFFPPDHAAGSPTDTIPPDLIAPLTVTSVLKRLSAVVTSTHPPNISKGKAALRALLTHKEANQELIQEVLRCAIIISENTNTTGYHFFDALSDVVSHDQHHFTFAQVACLGLTNLRHPSSKVRILAFNLLEGIHQQYNGLLAMSTFESSISSMAPATYVHAYRLVADFLAGEHPFQAVSILAQLGNWLHQVPPEAFDTNVIILLLQSLECWIQNINLMTDDRTELTREGTSCLYHLTALTLRFNQTHAEQILVLWSKLVDAPYQTNGRAAVTFLLEQAHKVGSTLFVTCASNIVASLCQTHIGRQVFQELCAVMLPTHMLPSVDHKLGLPPPDQQQLWEDLDLLFGGDQPRLALGSAQFAWLFLSDSTLQRYWEMKDQLPTLLHLVFIHIDHRLPFVRHRAHGMLFQLLRSWTSGYDELPERSTARSRPIVKESLTTFEKEAESLYWDEEDSGDKAIPQMKALLSRVVSFLEPLAPQLLYQWGSLSLVWGTACSIRATAFRSLQIFRALMPKVRKADFALLVGRLSSTIADAEDNIQAFTSEILSAIDAIAISDELDKTLVPQVFWCACACLSTTVEQEFGQVVQLLHSLVKRIDLDDPVTIDQLLCHRPIDWMHSPFIQPALLKGLRSSTTSAATMDLLHTLSKVQDDRIIDASGGRLRDLYTIILPWCLHAMDTQDASIKALAEKIAVLAANDKKIGIQRIMNSFSKGHFRTRDDFLRQSISSLRDFGGDNRTQIATHLLGLVLNEERWLRVYSMQVLKILFQQKDARNPVELLGSELLMPLLRLVETDLAPQALDVLEEPIVMSSNGPAAKHVLRMSMHLGSFSAPPSDPESTTVVFGVPQASGWSIAQVESLRETCRANILAVFDTCSVPMRPSRIDFEPEVGALAGIKTPLADDLGGLVRNLHEINTFFTDDSQSNPPKPSGASIPTRRLEARVAAILAKSTAAETYADIPQTPFLDVFNVGGGIGDDDDSDDSSDTDSDTDAFVFDTLTSPTPSRTPLANGRYH